MQRLGSSGNRAVVSEGAQDSQPPDIDHEGKLIGAVNKVEMD